MIRRFIGALAVVAIAMMPLVAPCVIAAEAADGYLMPNCGERGAEMSETNCCCTDSRSSASGQSGPSGVAQPPEASGFTHVPDSSPDTLSSTGQPVVWATSGRPIYLLNSTFLI